MTDVPTDTTPLTVQRQRRDFTQHDVAGLLGCSVRQVSRYEGGLIPDVITAFALARLYGVSVDRLFPEAVARAHALIPPEHAAAINGSEPLKLRIPGRVLGIDPWSRGIGYAVLDGSKLVRYGVKYLRRVPLTCRLCEQGHCIVSDLVRRFRPSIVALPALDTSRSAYVRQFANDITKLMQAQRLMVRTVAHADIERVIGRELLNKHELALAIAERFPELRDKVPPPRKIYEPQNLRMSMFEAVVQGLLSKTGGGETSDE